VVRGLAAVVMTAAAAVLLVTDSGPEQTAQRAYEAALAVFEGES
jgi:hypothetical protein